MRSKRLRTQRDALGRKPVTKPMNAVPEPTATPNAVVDRKGAKGRMALRFIRSMC